MGRIADFFNQDANAAVDRVAKPYVDFVLGHGRFMYVLFAAVVAATWIFASWMIALLIVALWLVATLWTGIAMLWKRRRS
jgi:hypothetical protein